MKRFAGIFLLAAILSFTGCGTPEEKPAPPPVKKEPAVIDVAVYYVKYTDNDMYLVREVHTVKETSRILETAVEELIRGKPQTKGAFTILPPDTEVLEISVTDKLATVNFSKEVLNANVGSGGEALGIQSIVNTLTEFETIDRVAFEVEGTLDERAKDWWGHVGLEQQPFTRDLSRVWEPPIWVNEPVPNQIVSSPLTVRGSARVFEATVNLRLRTDDGKILGELFTTATEGAPGRGEFEATIEYASPSGAKGTLEIFSISPKDGSEKDKVQIPLHFK